MVEIEGKQIIVTGGAGFIGSNLVERLAKANKVVVIDNLHTGSAVNLAKAIESGNVTVIEDNAKSIGDHNLKADIVFHLGFPSSTPMYRENPHLVDEVVAGMISVLEYAKKNSSKL
ncbi:MAG: NAD-dependent epimerase/dehydratase family protein, partial [Candidatus Micrarchaeota archaeon]|nr:NAD-dependent epimerase/dehydratase family protein [Candidatus Micrarchaeota archaeon]